MYLSSYKSVTNINFTRKRECTIFIQAKQKKSDGQSNIEKYKSLQKF